MKSIFTLLIIFYAFCQEAIAQSVTKPISRDQLVYYLSKAINVQSLCDYCKTSNGIYPGRLDSLSQIVDDVELAAMPSDRREQLFQADRQSGKLFERYQDMLRLIARVKPKLITDAVSVWGGGTNWPPWQMNWPVYLNRCAHVLKDIKAFDQEIVVQAAINEYVDDALLNAIGDIPAWVFNEFGLPQEHRKFAKSSIAFADYKTNATHAWSYSDGIVPDISRQETQMLFYYLAVTYINMGYECITFCQVELMNNQTLDGTNLASLFGRLRNYAATKGDIRFLLITGGTTGMKDEKGDLIFDYHSAPVRPSETGYSLNENGGGCYIDARQCWGGKGKLYQASLGGRTPSGWYCDELPGVVALDNWGPDVSHGGEPAGSGCNQYHWDEISWFGLQDKAYRDNWLRYASERVRQLDSNIFFVLPAKRVMVCASGSKGYNSVDYLANNPSADATLFPVPKTIDDLPNGLIDRYRVQLCAGYGQEETIKEILASSPVNVVPRPEPWQSLRAQ